MTTNLYVNEFLPLDAYAVPTRTRARAKDLTWVKAGKIVVRRGEAEPVNVISFLVINLKYRHKPHARCRCRTAFIIVYNVYIII